MTTCQLCDQPDPTGSYLCTQCTRTTRTHLIILPGLFETLGLLLAPGTSGGRGRTSTGGPAPLPLNADICDLRATFDVVADWLIAAHRDRHHRTLALPGSAETRLHTAVAGLLAHLPWIAVSWPAAGDFATEIRDLAASATTVVGPPGPGPERGRRIGHCPAQFEDGVICGAVLRLPPGGRVIRCEWCTTTYPPAMWAGLKQLVDADAVAA